MAIRKQPNPAFPSPARSAARKPAPQAGFALGLEFDHNAVRAVRLSLDGKGGCVVEGLADATGDFNEDADLLEGIRQVKDRLKATSRDFLVTCLAGKQVSVSQVPFRHLPPEEMEPALRLEMRKSIPFEIAGSTLDFQVLGEAASGSESVQVMVAISGAGLLDRHLKLMDKAFLSPVAVDVLPVAVANALWTWVGPPRSDAPAVALHIGPQISTIVIDGARSPFFNRYVYFAAEEFIGRDPGSPDLEKRVQSLAEEVARSLAFYEKSAHMGGFQEIALLGDYLDTPGVAERIRRQTGLAAVRMDLPRKLGVAHEYPPGRFDLALSLALRAEDA